MRSQVNLLVVSARLYGSEMVRKDPNQIADGPGAQA
jgi:hypothetical protein